MYSGVPRKVAVRSAAAGGNVRVIDANLIARKGRGVLPGNDAFTDHYTAVPRISSAILLTELKLVMTT